MKCNCSTKFLKTAIYNINLYKFKYLFSHIFNIENPKYMFRYLKICKGIYVCPVSIASKSIGLEQEPIDWFIWNFNELQHLAIFKQFLFIKPILDKIDQEDIEI